MTEYYDMIFKRKSFHLFAGVGNETIPREELSAMEQAYAGFQRLYPEIKTALRIIPASKVMLKRDAEYCVLLYSEKKENYLLNAGYLGQQLDLYLVSRNIGTLWYGVGKPDVPTYEGLEYVIMFAIRKVSDPAKYRRDLFKAKRKSVEEIWFGDDLGVANIARFAPSACNSQPWYVENRDGALTVYRCRKPGGVGILPDHAIAYFNRIDMGIFLCILEICLGKQEIAFQRELFCDDGGGRELTKVAVYRLP